MTAAPLLSFAEAAKELGVDLEKLRRLVVEDRAIGVVSVDRGGNRKTIDLEGLLGGGHWRVDEGGKLCVATGVYEQHQRVGTSYVPLDVGELRIEREQLIEYIQRTPPVEVIGGPDAADASPPPASIFGKPNLPMGLDPDTIASVFAGIWGTRSEWQNRLSKPGVWLKGPPVMMRKGIRGKGPTGEHVPYLRNPVEIAKYLISHERTRLDAVNARFMKSGEMVEWMSEWKAYRKQVADDVAYWSS